MMKKEITKRKVSERNIKAVKQLAEIIGKYSTVCIISIKGVPSSKLQEIRKNLRGKALIKASKKRVAGRALEAIGKENVFGMIDKLETSSVLLLSNENPFDIASLLSEYQFDIRAKIGQIAPKEITIEAGPTDLPPGPMLSELMAAGLRAGIEGGKIAIKERKVLTKSGEKISAEAANILAKLEMMPFRLGIDIIAAYDGKEKKCYGEIKIEREKALEDLKTAYLEAMSLACSVAYPAPEVIKQIISKAALEEKALESFLQSHSQEEK